MFVHTHAYSHTQSLLGKGRVRDSCATQGLTELQAVVLTARPKVPSDAQEQWTSLQEKGIRKLSLTPHRKGLGTRVGFQSYHLNL